MKKHSIYLLMWMVLILVLPGFAKKSKVVSVNESVIPFALQNHLIVVNCRINDSKEIYHFIVDTGALMFIDKALADQLQLKQQSQMAKLNTLTIGDYVAEKVFAMTSFNFDDFRKEGGLRLHGIIGSNLLERFTVTLDYTRKKMVLSSQPQSLQAIKSKQKGAYWFKFTKHPVNNAPMIACKLNDQEEVSVMVDTGQPYPLVLPLTYLEKMGVLQQKEVIKAKGSMIRWPGTVSPDNYLARTRSFWAGGMQKNNLLTLYAELPPLLSVPLLGGDFLKHFLITIDYPNSEMLLQPIKKFPHKGQVFGIGLHIGEDNNQELVVRGIWEKSPADLAGIQLGDKILEFNGSKLTSENQRQFWLMLSDDQVKQFNLVILSKSDQRKVVLKKENLLK